MGLCRYQSTKTRFFSQDNQNVAHSSVAELCPNFKDLENGDQLNYLLNSDGPNVKAVANVRFFYLANLMHSSVSIN